MGRRFLPRLRGRLRILFAVVLIGLVLLVSGMLAAAIELENHDSFCASCHTEPESTYYQRTLAAVPADLASAHRHADVGCIDCHSTEGIGGRLEALTQGAADLVVYLVGSYAQPAMTTNPIGDGGCTKCHVQPHRLRPAGADPGATISPSHYHIVELTDAWKAAARITVTCAQCHIPHADDAGAQQLWMTESAIATGCDQCHQAIRPARRSGARP